VSRVDDETEFDDGTEFGTEVVDDDPEGNMNEDTDDEPDATAAPTVYENLGSKVRKAVMPKRKTAIAAFNAYLTKINYQPSDFSQLSTAQLLQFLNFNKVLRRCTSSKLKATRLLSHDNLSEAVHGEYGSIHFGKESYLLRMVLLR